MNDILAIVGPTASGKSALDSMQIYRGQDSGISPQRHREHGEFLPACTQERLCMPSS